MATSVRNVQTNLPGMDTDSLAIAAKHGDPDAFAALVKRHQADVFRFLRRYLRDEGLAMDATQNTFIALHRSLERYQPTGRFTAYLTRLALNQGRMTARSRRLSMRLPIPLDVEMPAFTSSDVACDIEEVLQGISERLRVVVVLRYWQGLTGPEIAELLGLPIGTVKRRLFDAMTLMRRALNARA